MCPCKKRGGKKGICCPFCGLAEVSAGKGDRKLSFLSKEVPTERSAFGCCVTEVVGISASFFFPQHPSFLPALLRACSRS